ncbi:MAG: SPOR domain-containing protein [Candidatus Omnitrophica bacterium]|nr:SPOR domain-containing protein [Candidatus Omnitrophota bacterium]
MQEELFQDLEAQPRLRRSAAPLFPQRFLRVRVAYEDLIFSSLSFLLVLLAGFCLGVERGKRLADHPVAAPPAQAEWAVANAGLRPSLAVEPPAEKPQPPVMAAANGLYAIQLASYLDTHAAQAEAQRLNRQGFNAQVVKQNRYYELRVIGYRSREQATASLATLRKVYRDGFIKRLSS